MTASLTFSYMISNVKPYKYENYDLDSDNSRRTLP